MRYQDNSTECILGIEKELKKRLTRAGQYLEGEAVKKAPIDQGQLRGSMFSELVEHNGRLSVRVGNSAEYAIYVHQGTGVYALEGNGRKTPWRVPEIVGGKYAPGGWWTIGQKANPFLTTALNTNLQRVRQILGGG